MELHVAIIPETLAVWRGIPITNTLVTSVAVTGTLALVGGIIGAQLKAIPGKFQNAVEILFGGILDFMEETLGSRELAQKFFPLIITMFVFIWTANWAEFLPGVGSIGLSGDCGKAVCHSLFRSVNTDLNVTLALGMVAFLSIEAAGIRYLGFFSYAKKFINFKSPLNFFVGLVELVSEVARLVSFSFRLFGNIFAGEVLVGLVVALIPVVAPVPLILFELMVGLIQAAIFAVLTLFFIKIAITPHEEGQH